MPELGVPGLTAATLVAAAEFEASENAEALATVMKPIGQEEELMANLSMLGQAVHGLGGQPTTTGNVDEPWWKKIDGKVVHDVEDCLDEFHLAKKQRSLELTCKRSTKFRSFHREALANLDEEARANLNGWHSKVNELLRVREHIADRFLRKEQIGGIGGGGGAARSGLVDYTADSDAESASDRGDDDDDDDPDADQKPSKKFGRNAKRKGTKKKTQKLPPIKGGMGASDASPRDTFQSLANSSRSKESMKDAPHSARASLQRGAVKLTAMGKLATKASRSSHPRSKSSGPEDEGEDSSPEDSLMMRTSSKSAPVSPAHRSSEPQSPVSPTSPRGFARKMTRKLTSQRPVLK
eukprot:TRINITY_DN18881_c0_g1_i1.p1 TRINITY_DN18881_c0_g1~~TRINITY_DN18881_c0_g1_i1.p1  ORF type:complete len:352 (+),score=73.05 TRINITY_DN18881_c0_g1_i1:166-1221(+)